MCCELKLPGFHTTKSEFVDAPIIDELPLAVECTLAPLKASRPDESAASWAFRFLSELPNVTMVLSGMSNMAQMQDNVATFSGGNPLTV